MKITLLVVGKTDVAYIRAGMEDYLSRLSHYARVTVGELAPGKGSPPEVKRSEGRGILDACMPGDALILLDEKGEHFTSREFSAALQKQMNASPKRIVFVIGGAFGFSDEVYKRSNRSFALSKLTFPHQLVRLIFLEQLYRAFTILRSEGYHHD